MQLLGRKFIVPTAALGLLTLMAALVLWGNVPTANAQRTSVHVFEGKIIVDGRPAQDGTRVDAYIDGVRVTGERTSGGRFRMEVRQPVSLAGRTVEFRGRDVDRRELRFPQTARWQPGGQTAIALEAGSGRSFVVSDEVQTHVFRGQVFIDGQPAPDGTGLQAYADGVRIRGARTKGGRFRMEVRQPASFAGRTVEFRGGGVRFPQRAVWKGGETSITLEFPETRSPIPGLPSIPGLPEGLDIACVLKVLGRMPAGLQDMTPQESLKVAQNCFSSSTQPDGTARLELERKLQEGQQALDKQRLDEERSLQEERDRLDEERLVRDRARQQDQARLDQEGLEQDQERIRREREFEEQRRSADTEREKQRIEQERQRFLQQGELDRERFERERKLEEDRIQRERELDEQRARLDQERFQAEQKRLDQEFAQREERLRREQELDRQELRQPPSREDSVPPPEPDVPEGPTRGFFTNSAVGSLGSANQFMDPTMLAVLGILLTLGATVMQMVKGS
ncbi:MAG: hypothetical protein IH962_02965 [Chloroflexi bacterium]|nr:hypothetical protein [Chloroflexota bacterium]